ncbi:GMC oxidoreductase-domain-containing protein [Panaeolus papilionaceus]|nr:GMC oxidoreductase-domain-containing protein [Panaeolus papilionaceus]
MVTNLVNAESEYDIIFAGGGATACVTAGRLIDQYPSLKILLIEYGNHTLNVARHVQPGHYMRLLANPEVLHFHEGVPSPALGGRVPVVPTGKGVGGGSSVNFMVYTRGAASDYDDWETVYGNKGWSTESLMPLFKKIETYQDAADNDTHGYDGPLKISFAPDMVTVADNFLDTARVYDKGREHTDDTNNFYNCNKYGRWARYIDKETGTRSDAAHHYIYNKTNPNLGILTENQVIRVIFENGRAVGVEYQSVTSTDPVIRTVRARKLVVLSAGALGTPPILERSGIGSSKVLQQCSIPQVVDLSGVGEHYMDHNFIYMHFLSTPDIETLDEIFWGTEDEFAKHTEAWLKDGQGLMSHNSSDAGIKIRPTDEEVSKMSPAFQKRWKEFFANSPDKPLVLLYLLATHLGGRPPSFDQKYYCLGYLPAYPATSGYIHITSKDLRSKPEFHPGYLDHPADADTLRWAYKRCRELGRRMKNFRGEYSPGHPGFSSSSSAAVVETAAPFNTSAADITYSPEDDTVIDQFNNERIRTSWHSCGTCAMKARKDGGVVDDRLNVYGVEGLKIADCSIFPENVGANTYNTALVIGEKAAVLIAEDLNL